MVAIAEKKEKYSVWHFSRAFFERLKLTCFVDSSVLTYSQLRALPIASELGVSNVENWLYNNPTAIAEQESEFIKKKDLISLESRSKSTFGGFFKIYVALRNHWLWRQASDEGHHQVNRSIQLIKTNLNCVELVPTLGADLLMFIMPLWFLDILQEPCARLGLIIVFIMAFVGDYVGCCEV